MLQAHFTMLLIKCISHAQKRRRHMTTANDNKKGCKLIMPLTYEEISIGDSYTLKKTITEAMVREFADFSGDYNPVHMDENYCRSHGLQSRIVHGMLILSFLSTLIGMYLPGEGTVWMSQSIDFITPAKIDDTVEIIGEVSSKSEANALRLKIIVLKIRIRNQLNHLIAKGFVKVTVK
jgi:3-hydroxybutyryl-CoA dehydratase